ncbi:MAG: nucleotidyltransferase [bacterium]
MLTNSDFRELLNLFERHEIRFLVVGGYAVMKYSEPRFTKDLDLWIATDPENARAVYAALKEFGAPLANLTADDFTHRAYFYQMGRPPLRVDIMMSIPGIEFEEAWKNREVVELDELKIPFISRSDLIRSKEASGRPQDRIDIDKLREAEQLDTRDEK